MKSSLVSWLLLALNLFLVGAVVYFMKTWPGATTPFVAQPAPAPAPAPETAVVTSAEETPPAPQVVVVTNDFRWAQLESEDYRAYIERLRSIGCPEQTIRDIIIADLDKLLAPKVQSIYGRKPDLKYWQSEEEELANNHDPRDWLKQERAIDQDKREIVRELLGVDLARERLKQRGYEDYYERRLGFLPEAKRSEVRALLEKFDDQEQALRDKERYEGEPLAPADQARLRQLREQRTAALAGVLSPAEREQYELWMSPTANAVRYSMYGMDASEEEFRAVYGMQKEFDAKWQPERMDLQDEAGLLAWQQARQELEIKVRQQLGEERYALYQRGQDQDFHLLNTAVSRYKLPREKAAEAYEIKRTVQQMTAEVQANPGLTPAQKDEAIKAMRDETEFALGQLLGNPAYRYFKRRSDGDWFHSP